MEARRSTGLKKRVDIAVIETIVFLFTFVCLRPMLILNCLYWVGEGDKKIG